MHVSTHCFCSLGERNLASTRFPRCAKSSSNPPSHAAMRAPPTVPFSTIRSIAAGWFRQFDL
eukprot:5746129-Alexandrium_andersonii.AAC.1